MAEKNLRFETLQVHAGQVVDPVTKSRQYLSTQPLLMFLTAQSMRPTFLAYGSLEIFTRAS